MKKIALIPLLGLLLVACNPSQTSSNSEPTNLDSNSEPLTSETSQLTSDVDVSSTPSTSENKPSESTPTSTEETPSEIPSTSEDKDSETIENEDPIPSLKEQLPIGNTSVSGPKNLANPVDITEYTNFNMFSSLPENFTFIQGNNKIKNCNDFYAESAGGGFQFRHLYYGFQTSLFNSWNKIEVRLQVSAVTRNSKKADPKKPPFMHVYGYNNKGKFIYQHNIEQGKLTEHTKEIKFYIENQPEVQYLEFRLNAFPFKGSQCYNFGVSNVMLKGWPRV